MADQADLFFQTRRPPAHAPAIDGETYDRDLDRDRLATQLERVQRALSNGRWWTLTRLQMACGGSEAGISARIRDLRKPEHGSHLIEHRRVPGAERHGVWQYRMVR